MPDIDVDAWLAGKRKSAPVAPQASSPDPDAWLQRKRQPQAPNVVLPTERQQFNRPRLGYENVTGIQPEQGPGLGENVGIGAERGYRKYLQPALSSIGEVVEGATVGDFRPAWRMTKEAVRGTYRALTPPSPKVLPDESGRLTRVQMREPDPVLEQAQRQREARYQASPQGQRSAQRLSELDRRASLDPSITGKATRGATELLTGAAPTIAAAVASRGALLPTGIAAAAQSANNPGMMGPQAAAAMLPAPSIGKLAAPLVRRLRGRASVAAPEVAATQRLPEPQVRPTQRLPRTNDYTVETAPTRPGLGLPTRERISELPELYAEPLGDFEVRANLNPVKPKAPGAVGPRANDELTFNYRGPQQQAPMLQPPGTPKTPLLETITAVRKAGLLSGVPTHVKNIVGNVGFAGAEEVARIPASITDLAISAVTKRRTITGPSPTAMARSGISAATEGVKEAGQILRRGMTNNQAAQLQLGREINSGSKVLDAYVNGVFRTLGAEDAVFRKYAFTRAIQDRARAQALTEARQGVIPRSQINTRARQLASKPDPAMEADAIFDSEVATFNNPSLVNRFVQSGMDAIAPYPGGRAANFGVELALPFRNAPSNSVAKILEYTPLGLLKNGAQAIRAVQARAFTPEMQRQFSTTMGRTITGSSLILLGYQLGKAGLMTGYNETDPSKRNRDIAAGRTPGAILDPTTNTWHSVIGFGPVGPLMVIGATLSREEGRELKDESKRASNIAAGVVQTIKEQPLMSGAKDISEAISQPASTGERLGNIAGSFVPTMVSKVGELTDSTKREAKGFTGQIQRRIPGLRNYLPEQTDVLGRPVESRKTGFFDPTQTSTAKDKTDSLMRELTRLDVGLTAPQQKKDEGETDAQYRERKALAGRWLQNYAAKLMASRAYQSASKDEQKAAWSRLQRAIHDESDNPEPNTERFNAAAIIEAIRESAYLKKERLRK